MRGPRVIVVVSPDGDLTVISRAGLAAELDGNAGANGFAGELTVLAPEVLDQTEHERGKALADRPVGGGGFLTLLVGGIEVDAEYGVFKALARRDGEEQAFGGFDQARRTGGGIEHQALGNDYVGQIDPLHDGMCAVEIDDLRHVGFGFDGPIAGGWNLAEEERVGAEALLQADNRRR